MSGVMIQMIMFDAEKQNSIIKADVGYMENYKALQEIKDFEQLVMTKDFTLTKKSTLLNAKLPGLGQTVQIQKVIVQDEATQAKNLSLEAEVSSLRSKLETMKAPSSGGIDPAQVKKFER